MIMSTTTIDQVQDAYLEGITDFDTFIQEFDAEFFKPIQEFMQVTLYATMTDGEKEIMRAIMGDAFTEIEEQVERLMEV
jgi:hypothetical protein